MENPLNNNCKPNEHYSKSESALILGISRPTLDKYIRLGIIKVNLHKISHKVRIKGTELIKYYNSIS
jgi:predicted site-specific integrase-resolvase